MVPKDAKPKECSSPTQIGFVFNNIFARDKLSYAQLVALSQVAQRQPAGDRRYARCRVWEGPINPRDQIPFTDRGKCFVWPFWTPLEALIGSSLAHS